MANGFDDFVGKGKFHSVWSRLGGEAFVMHFSPIPRGFSGLLFDLENKIPGVSRGSTPGKPMISA